jgi:hypothetical protein
MRKGTAWLRAGVALALSLCAGCAWYEESVKALDEMSPREKATWMLALYNTKYEEYVAAAAKPALGDDERQVLRVKKDALTFAWPLIKAYVSYVEAGAVDKDAEAACLEAIGALAAL